MNEVLKLMNIDYEKVEISTLRVMIALDGLNEDEQLETLFLVRKKILGID